MNRQQNTWSLRGSLQADAAIHRSLDYFASPLFKPRNNDSVLALARMTALKNQSGNVLWFILVAIGLLGLLTVMMSRSASTSNETGSYEQNAIAANEILSYAKNIENAVQSLLARGCSENDISFWHDSDDNGLEDASDDYFNTVSTLTDHSCHVFDVAGAGMSWDTPDAQWLDGGLDTRDLHNEFVFSTTCVNGAGRNSNVTACNTPSTAKFQADLIIAIPYIKEEICSAVNSLVNDSTSIPVDPFNYIKIDSLYKGNFAQDSTAVNYASPNNDNSGCHTGDSAGLIVATGEFGFYHVLHAR